MQFAQPAVTKLRWELWESNQGVLLVNMPVLKAAFNIPNGLTMGQLYDLVVGTADQHNIKKPDMARPNGTMWSLYGTEDSPGRREKDLKPVELVVRQELQHGRIENWVPEGLSEPILRSLFGGNRDLSHFGDNPSSLECLFRTSSGHVYIDEFAILGREIAFDFFLSAAQDE